MLKWFILRKFNKYRRESKADHLKAWWCWHYLVKHQILPNHHYPSHFYNFWTCTTPLFFFFYSLIWITLVLPLPFICSLWQHLFLFSFSHSPSLLVVLLSSSSLTWINWELTKWSKWKIGSKWVYPEICRGKGGITLKIAGPWVRLNNWHNLIVHQRMVKIMPMITELLNSWSSSVTRSQFISPCFYMLHLI